MKKEILAELVRMNRIKMNLTQQELADLTGLSLRSIQRIEHSEVVPRDYTIKTLARQLDFQLENLRVGHSSERSVLNHQQKLIASTGLGLVITILAFAFVFQCARFPESAFELSLYVAGCFALYFILLLRIWR